MVIILCTIKRRYCSKQNRLTLVTICGLFSLFGPALAQTVTAEQLKAALPDEKAIKGFTRLRPAGERYLLKTFSREQGKWIQPVSPSLLLQDQVSATPGTANFLSGNARSVPSITRQLYSVDGTYTVTMTADVFATLADAEKATVDFRRACSSPFLFGRPSDAVKFDFKTYSFSGRPPGVMPFGDESYYNVNRNSTLLLRTGRMLILIDGSRSYQSSKLGNKPGFPVSTTEAIANEIVKRASTAPRVVK